MIIDWRSIDAHQWSDENYALGIKYLKEKSIGKPNKKGYNKTDDGWKAFKKKRSKEIHGNRQLSVAEFKF